MPILKLHIEFDLDPHVRQQKYASLFAPPEDACLCALYRKRALAWSQHLEF